MLTNSSKTIIGLSLLLIVTISLSLAGKLDSGNVADILKWIGTAFMAARASDNVTQNLGK